MKSQTKNTIIIPTNSVDATVLFSYLFRGNGGYVSSELTTLLLETLTQLGLNYSYLPYFKPASTKAAIFSSGVS